MKWLLIGTFLVLGGVFSPQKLNAQTATLADTIRGHVSDLEGTPLVGATVRWKETNVGTYTDARGSFEIVRVPETDTLVISFLGFMPEQVSAKSNHIMVHLDVATAQAVEVVADETTISKSIIRTELVTKKELTRAACCSLAESFERSPSVEVSYSDAVSGARTIRMLGLRGQYTQMLTEAVPLMRSLEVPFGMDHIPGPFMTSISISKGAGTVSSGYESMTGAINICMQDPFDAEPLYVNAFGNTMERFELNAYAGQWISPSLATVTLLHGRIREREVDNNNDGFLDAPKMRQLNAVHKWMFNNDEIEWQLFLHGVLDGYTSGQVSGTTSGQSDGRLYSINTDIERFEAFMKLGLLDVFWDLEKSSAAIIVSGVMHNMFSSFGDRTVEARQRTGQVKGILTATLSDEVSLNTGLTYRYDHVTETLLSNSFRREEHVPGAYAEVTLTPSDEFSVLAGGRIDVHNLYGTRVIPRVNVRWQPTQLTSVRLSGGRGWRVPSVVTENLTAYINSRVMHFDDSFRPEDSWNYGAAFTTSFQIGDRPIVFDVEAFRTEFSNKVIIDFDQSARDVYISNLDGRSHSTSIMAQIQATPLPQLDVAVAYRWIDVQAPLNGVMQLMPMISRDRVLFTLAWETVKPNWQVDGTITYFGPGRLPSTSENPVDLQRLDTFPGYWRINAQVTKKFDVLDFYAGMENINGFIQQDPIIGANDPFGEFFDASLAWGPTSPRIAYFGVRFVINR